MTCSSFNFPLTFFIVMMMSCLMNLKLYSACACITVALLFIRKLISPLYEFTVCFRDFIYPKRWVIIIILLFTQTIEVCVSHMVQTHSDYSKFTPGMHPTCITLHENFILAWFDKFWFYHFVLQWKCFANKDILTYLSGFLNIRLVIGIMMNLAPNRNVIYFTQFN